MLTRARSAKKENTSSGTGESTRVRRIQSEKCSRRAGVSLRRLSSDESGEPAKRRTYLKRIIYLLVPFISMCKNILVEYDFV
jgi:hypothetical protein